MLVKEQVFSLQSNGVQSRKSFTIKASSKAFDILNGLYSNHIQAIVRELGTNAADAHVAAGKKATPFTVHLPNQLEPFFSVKDTGTGLSPEAINTVYTVYFESDKINSDDFTGCLGLGSKTPLNYTDNSCVTSCYNGTKYSYTAFKNEYGCPDIALMNSEPTDEPDGLEVAFGVKPTDFQKFYEEAIKVYEHFEVRPEVVGYTIDYYNHTPLFSGESWSMYKSMTSYGNCLIMGNVRYPVDFSQAGCYNSLFNNYCLVIKCPIGEVDFVPSREALKYTDKTKKAVAKRVKEALEVFSENLQKELDAQPTLWDACKFYHAHSLFLQNATYDGQRVVANIELKNSVETHYFTKQYGSKIKFKRSRNLYTVRPHEDYIFVENDIARGAIDRVKQHMRNTVNAKAVYLLKFDSPEAWQEFHSTVGMLPPGVYLKASALPKVVRPKSANRVGNKKPACFAFDASGSERKPMSMWKEEATPAGGVYVELERWTPSKDSFHFISTVTSALQCLGKNITVYGIRRPLLNKVKKSSNWRSLKEFLAESVKDYEADYEYAKSMYEYQKYDHLLELAHFLPSGDWQDLLGRVDYVKKNRVRLANIASLMFHASVTKQERDVDKEVEELKKKYPLLFFIIENSRSTVSSVGAALADYIKMVDEKGKALLTTT